MTDRQRPIKTRFLVLSDTHGLEKLAKDTSKHTIDVVIHCGDLTTESKLEEFKASIRLLNTINAPLKIAIAGNHDFTMDIAAFRRKVADVKPPLDPTLVKQTYGYDGEARKLFDKQVGITFLDDGTHEFRLNNGAMLRVYASPYTPSLGDWGFQYHPDHGHNFAIPNVDVAITHGPPKGVMDMTYSAERAGCPVLFEAIARARPLMHCFGHIHEGWGAKLITWRQKPSAKPSHLTYIDNERSTTIAKLSTERKKLVQSPAGAFFTSNCHSDLNPLKRGLQTLFVNAAIEGEKSLPIQPAWIVDLDLSSAC
ncbi:Uncharacterized protein PECH_001800 [Penicillium ucsense]|uniref:Calcineurin-like phosphoesterase domain-containing protein n=1 Tax=Penicillium ucsense TaxID=2839758 RepID=A0A8J8W932_9EURO|nr:Uncharacterized protein PECM_008098 [Penicillium ucsense]KAF7738148.1 Uncharacterized protein PECH_001800 [Penicillium ucsense]